MINRTIKPFIEKLLKQFPAIVLLGPRQVGKTTLVKQLAKNLKKPVHYMDMEKHSDFRALDRDAENYLMAYLDDCVIIDEVQRMPALFPLLRHLIDEKRKPARYIITGSASPHLLKGASESLAGRVFYLHLHPVGLHELPAHISMKRHWLRGGFPEVLTMRNAAVVHNWLGSFITTYIEKDLPFLFDVRFSPVVMRKLWMMLAHNHGQLLNAEKLGNSLDITGTTVKRYLDYLEGAFIIHRLPPFFTNIGKRLVKAPKVYINDSGLLHHLLRIETEKELLHHPAIGASWEGYVVSQIMYAKHDRTDMHFYRTQAGAECDIVLARGHIVLACIEVKFSSGPNLSKGFYQAINDLKCKKNFVVCNSAGEWKNKEGILLTSLENFLKKHLPKL